MPGETRLDLIEARDDGVWRVSTISWTIYKQFSPCSKQITTPAPLHSIFTDWMLFVTPDQVSKHWRLLTRTKSLKVLNIFEDSPIFCTSGTLWLSQDSSLKPIRDAGNVFSNRYTWRTCWLDYLKYSELPKKYDDNWQLEGHKCRLIVIFVIVAEFVLKLSWVGMPWHRGLLKTP